MFLTAPFINLLKSKDEAMSFKASPVDAFYNFNGIQLIPNTSTKYIQVTNTPDGLHLEDWTVKLVDMCTDEILVDLTEEFLVEVLTNSDNGDPQFYWSVTNIPYDAGRRLVYLKVTQTIGETFYSTPFLCTTFNEEFTSLFHYRYDKLLPYQSITLATWFNQNTKVSELSTYYEISTHQTVSVSLKYDKLAVYKTELMSFDQLINMSDMLENPYTYIDWVRCNLYEAIKIPDKTSQENFGETKYQLSLKQNDILNPDNVIPSTITPVGPTISTNVTAWALDNQVHYLEIDVQLPSGVNYLGVMSSAKVDKTTVGFTSTNLGGGLIRLTTLNTPANSALFNDWVYLINLTFKVISGPHVQTYSVYPGPIGYTLNFSPAEINNNTIKTLILNIS